MTLDEYVQHMIDTLQRFQEKMKTYDDMPETMPFAEWDEQWIAYLEIIDVRPK